MDLTRDLHEQHAQRRREEHELTAQIERLETVLTGYQADEAKAKAAVRRNDLTVEELIEVQARRKTTEDLLDEAREDLEAVRSSITKLEADLDRETALQTIAELAQEGDELKRGYERTVDELLATLREKLAHLASQGRALAEQRSEMADALAVAGFNGQADAREAVVQALEGHGITRESILAWPFHVDTAALFDSWTPTALRDARPMTPTQHATSEQQYAYAVRDLLNIAYREERNP